MIDGEYVTLESGTRVGRCSSCGTVTGSDVRGLDGHGECGRCGRPLVTDTVLSKPLEVSADGLA